MSAYPLRSLLHDSFTDPARGWIVGEQSGSSAIYATTDGGTTWARQL